VSREEIGKALAALAAVLHEIEHHYWEGAMTAFEHFIASRGADALVYYLGEAIEADRQRLERLRSGRRLSEEVPR